MKNIKIKYYFWIIIYILNISLGLQAQEGATNSVVEVQGLGKDADTALKNAIYQAVEQAVGAYVDQETVIKNEEIIQNKLLSVAQGFVERYDVIMDPKERRDGSGIWEIKIKAVVKKSDVGAALRKNGVVTIAADGTSSWAKQITMLKNQNDAIKLLDDLLPQITKNLICGRIIQEDSLKTSQDEKTGDLLVEVQIEYDTDIEWWNKEAYPALDAALSALSLLAKPPSSKEVDAVRGKPSRGRQVDDFYWIDYKYDPHVIKIYTPHNKYRTKWIERNYYLPSDLVNKFVEKCASTIAPMDIDQNLQDFGLDFCDKDGTTLLTIPVVPAKYGSPHTGSDVYSNNYSKPCSVPSINDGYTNSPALINDGLITIMPEFFSLSNGGGGEFSKGFNYRTKPILVTHRYKISPDILKETKSLRLTPKRYGVTEKLAAEPVTPEDTAHEKSPDTLEFLIERRATKADVEGWDVAGLSFALNYLYARQGYPFRNKGNESLRQAFEGYSWYRPVEGMTDDEAGGKMPVLVRQNMEFLAGIRAELKKGAPTGDPRESLTTDFISYRDATKLTMAEIRYSINYLYARHGFPFEDAKSEPIRREFARFPWYRPVPGRTMEQIDRMMNPFERQNVEVLAEARRKK